MTLLELLFAQKRRIQPEDKTSTEAIFFVFPVQLNVSKVIFIESKSCRRRIS